MKDSVQYLDIQKTGWKYVDCHCCNGIRWGGEYPVECSYCKGAAFYFKHIESGVLAEYPGGPFLGRESKEDRRLWK